MLSLFFPSKLREFNYVDLKCGEASVICSFITATVMIDHVVSPKKLGFSTLQGGKQPPEILLRNLQ